MLLEKYAYKNDFHVTRTEDDFLYGFEYYRAGAPASYLVQLCVGAYGFRTRKDAKAEAIRRFEEGSFWKKDDAFSLYIKTYKMDRNRNVIKETIVTECIYESTFRVTEECLREGTIESDWV